MSNDTYNIDTSQISEEMINAFKMTMDPSAIPDLENMLTHIDNLIEYAESTEMRILSNTNYQEYETKIYQRFNQHIPIKMISLLIDENERYDNLDGIIGMFETLKDIKEGKKNMQNEYEKFSEKLNEKYLYPDFGGKENFINEMKNSAKKDIKK